MVIESFICDEKFENLVWTFKLRYDLVKGRHYALCGFRKGLGAWASAGWSWNRLNMKFRTIFEIKNKLSTYKIIKCWKYFFRIYLSFDFFSSEEKYLGSFQLSMSCPTVMRHRASSKDNSDALRKSFKRNSNKII